MGRNKARSPKKVDETAPVLFNVIYQDGAQTSNRRVPLNELLGRDEDDAARAWFEAEDRRIAELSGRPRGPIKAIIRVDD